MSYYSVQPLESFDDVRKVFDPTYVPPVIGPLTTRETDYTLNWVFASTSGVHGSYCSIDDVLARWDGDPDYPDEEAAHDITILIVLPRCCILRYGTVEVTKQDLADLRVWIGKTLEGVQRSQEGNT